ncbi:hypothetical protein PFISCL1PPCAC_2996, partial [Pristionchus fissidentatus]
SPQTPVDVNQVRPADIAYIAALGDSITTGVISFNLAEEYDGILESFSGNSFDMGGDGRMETHLTLPNILRHLNPKLVGFSRGRQGAYQNSVLNVAVGGRSSNDLPRQARELVERFKKYPASSVQSDWKLIHIFIGTNDIWGLCTTNNGTTKEAYKNFVREAIVIIQQNLPRSIISLIGTFTSVPRALAELAAEPAHQTKDQTVVVQNVFDNLYEPLRKADGAYDVNFYAFDVFHLSKYGNSLVAKQLWKQLLQPIGNKTTTNDEMADGSDMLACPDEVYTCTRSLVYN